MEIDKVVDYIRKIKQDLANGERQKDVANKYGISAKLLPDIQSIEDMNNFKKHIEFIRESLNSGNSLRRVSMELPYGSGLFNYIVKKICDKDIKEITSDNRKEYANKMESMWRLYKAGEDFSAIACIHKLSIEETQYIVENFEDRVNVARRRYIDKTGFNKEVEIKKTRDDMGKYLSDDIVDYILYGKPINFSKKGNIGEDGRDDL